MEEGRANERRWTLTERQDAALRFVSWVLETTGRAPTVDELARHLDVGFASAYYQLHALERKGYLRRVPDVGRGLVVLRGVD